MAESHLKLVAPSRAPDARAPDRDRDREAAQRSRNEPLGPPGRHDDLGGLPPRPQGERAGGPALGPNQFRHSHPARPPGQAGHPATHPILGDELRALRRLQREQERHSCSRPNVARRSARRALLAWWSALGRRPSWASRRTLTCCATPVASLWPTAGNTRALQAYLGHRNIQHTVRYTELAPIGSRGSGVDVDGRGSPWREAFVFPRYIRALAPK